MAEHGRLIDADALKRKAQKVATEAWKMKVKANVETVLNQFIDWIDDAQTIEPERKTGEWIIRDNPAEIQKMQELEQAELQKAYECGRASAQPEIIRCKDCKWYGLPSHKITENCVKWVKRNSILLPIKPDDFCSYAERREE